jgi:2-C-methyl-D-erythritol 4-phosphate cytidylyltransferase/2-C-methyl-D-erythritol 2,4-cyclodiphosphate synthase
MHNNTFDLILLAAGKGRRLGGENKALLKIKGRSFIEYELDIFSSFDGLDNVIITYHTSNKKEIEEAIKGHKLYKKVSLIKGGSERAYSVYNALLSLKNSKSEIVVIHDVARPNITEKLISRGIETAKIYGSAIPAIPLVDTIKVINKDRIINTIPRDGIYQIQTPQIFNKDLISYAYFVWSKNKDRFIPTDDSSLLENLGISPRIYEGDRENIKITYREDMNMINQPPQFRIGYGYDIHRLKRGGKLYLGGVLVEEGISAIAHSDGDVLIHSICDALLGAAGLRDIGYYFPNSDNRFKGIGSLSILKETFSIISQKGFRIVNIDSTIVLERPKIGKFIPDMKNNIARILNISNSAIGIKATTPEKTGEIGKGKAFASYSIALLTQ